MRAFLLILFSIIAYSSNAQAKAEIENPIYDFGSFIEGADSTHTFLVKNTGTTPLYIISVSKPCGCTSATFSSQPILPNGTGSVTIKYSSMGKTGAFNKTLQVKTNDPNKQISLITIKGTVLKKEE